MEQYKAISYQEFKKNKPSWTKPFRRNLEYYSLLAGFKLGKRLSLEKLQMLGKGVGHIAYYLFKKDRGIVEKQLALAFPNVSETQRHQWTYECFLHFGQMAFEVLGIEAMYHQDNQRLQVSGEECLQEGLERGKGIILLGEHLGNWELLGPYFFQTDYFVKAGMASFPDERLNDFFVRLRERGRVTLIQRGKSGAARAMLECFKQNEMFLVRIDQDTHVPSMFVPFFGIPAKTPIVASNLALRTGALVVGASVLRKPRGQFQIQFERIGIFEKKNFNKQDIYEVTKTFNEHLEKIIQRHPTQWSWFHRRWKNQPSEADLHFLEEMNRLENGS